MKRSNQLSYMLISLMLATLFSGCSTRGVLAVGSDKTLPKITKIKYLVGKSSIGFEWPAIKDSRVKGIKVYRSTPQSGDQQKYKRIATIDDRYATHYVDRRVAPSKVYQYTFTTYSLVHESLPGAIVRVKTESPYDPISFTKVYMSDKGVAKILWSPHSNNEISGYIIERKIAGGKWKYLARVRGRLMPEYIDKSAAMGYEYSYRIIARSVNGTKSLPSDPVSLRIK